MSSTTSNQDQDLQTYLDTFNKEIDEVTLSAEAVEALTGVDEVQQSDECQDDVGAEGEEENDGTYLVDQGGYYYFQSSKKAGSGRQVVTKAESAILKQAGKATASSVVDEEAEADDVGYVFIMDDCEAKSESGVAAETEADVEAGIGELIDTGDTDRKEVYEFDETEIPEKEDCDDPPIKTGKVIRLKPVNSDPNAEVHRCMYCQYTTTKRFRLSRHMKFHSDDRPFKCSVCERGFKTNASLMNHVNVHLGNKPHSCESCEKRFTTSGELMRHMRYRHTGEKPHKCSECDYSSVELSKLRRHMRCHTGERPYQCPHCTYASPDTFKLKRHLRTHTGEKPYECEICNARFTQSNSLKSHRLIHSVGDKPVFQCALCPTTCGRKTDLRLHMQKLHHSEHPITCKRCGKDLPDRYSYKVHTKTHEGERCYRCKLCPYASISMRHLESHMLVHTDQKPYICETCGMAFRQRPLLSRHVNLYHNKDYVPPTPREKVHTCPHCKRAFTHKGNLMRHMEMHDPDSNAEREKLKLKIGRMARVQPDGSILTVGTGKIYGEDDDTQEEYEEDNLEGTLGEEDYEIIETMEEEVEQKPVVVEGHNNVSDNTTTVRMEFVEDVDEVADVSIKKESERKELLAVQVEDGQQYMVVLQTDDEEEDDDGENCIAAKIIELPAATKKKANLINNFGFEEDESEEYNHEPNTKETIRLLEIIEEN